MNSVDSDPGLKRQLTTARRLHPGRMLQPKRRALRIYAHNTTNPQSVHTQAHITTISKFASHLTSEICYLRSTWFAGHWGRG